MNTTPSVADMVAKPPSIVRIGPATLDLSAVTDTVAHDDWTRNDAPAGLLLSFPGGHLVVSDPAARAAVVAGLEALKGAMV